MPAELVGVAAQLVFEAGSNVLLMVYGGRDTRSGAVVRLVFHLLLMLLSGALLVLSLITLPDHWYLALPLAVGMAFLCYMLANSVVNEIERLRHWGEPQLVATAEGLSLPGRNKTIPWATIQDLMPKRRGLRIKVEGRRPVFVATAEAERLAAAIRAQMPSR